MKGSGFRVTAGIVFFVLLIIIMASNTTSILTSGVSMIDTEINRSNWNSGTFVRTKMDFGKNEHIEAFPDQIAEWEMRQDYDWPQIKEALGVDTLFVRAYEKDGFYQPLFFLVAQSKDLTSFHPPPVCYRALGYEIDDESVIYFPVTDRTWAAQHWRSIKEGNIFAGDLSAKRLIVSRRDAEGNILERRALIYYFVRDSGLTSNTITMIEVSTIIPGDSDYNSNIDMLRKWIGDATPEMFVPRQSKDELLGAKWTNSHGIVGWITIIMALSMPLAVVFWPVIKPRIPIIKNRL